MMAASARPPLLLLPPLARLLSPLLAMALLVAVPARADLEVQLGMIEKKCFRFVCLGVAARRAKPPQLTWRLALVRSDDLQRGELLVGIYSVSPNSNQQSDVIVSVMGPNDVPMYDNGGAAEGKFAFTASEAGVYTLCFTNNGLHRRSHCARVRPVRRVHSRVPRGAQLCSSAPSNSATTRASAPRTTPPWPKKTTSNRLRWS